MAILKNVGLKTSTIDEITANFDGAQGVVVVNYSGLTVEQDTQLRKQLREAGVVYKVYKNTLVRELLLEQSSSQSLILLKELTLLHSARLMLQHLQES